MADDIDRTQEREERMADELQRRIQRFAPPEVREGVCEECGLSHPRLARVSDPEQPGRMVWACAPCRNEREAEMARVYGRKRVAI
jgi:hypothetical protein